jgi:glycosyltransferase involved in cell wall biosynthesis
MGGVEKNALLLSKELLKESHSVIVGAGHGILAATFVTEGIRVVPFDFQLSNVMTCLKDIHRLETRIQEERPDIIHVFSAAPGVLLQCVKLYRCLRRPLHRKMPPIVASIMGLQTDPDEKYLKTQLRNFLICCAAQHIYVISPAIGKFARRIPRFRDRLRDCDVVGIKMPENVRCDTGALKKELGIPLQDRIVMTIGRLDPCKSHELFIETALRILDVRNDVTFLIVGTGVMEKRLQGIIDSGNASGKIRLLGLRHDVYELLSICDVYMKPGIVEGFIGITVLEAQAMKVPVVAWFTEDVTTAVRHGTTGLIIPNTDTKEMALTILTLLKDREFARMIGNNGFEFVRVRFPLEVIARNLAGEYKKEIGMKNPLR